MSSSRELQYLEYTYRNNRPTTGLLNSIFMTTVNTAARSLVSVASTASTPEMSSRRWSASDHLRFMSMMMTWLTLWFIRVFLDYLPRPLISSSSSSSSYSYSYSYSYPPFSFASGLLTAAAENALVPVPASSSSSTSSTALVKYSGSSDLGMRICDGVDEPSVNSLGRALCHALAIMNEIPVSSRKYHFAMGMAEKIMEDNAQSNNLDLLDVNRAALALSFARTTASLQDCLKRSRAAEEPFGGLPLRVVSALPLGGYVASYVRGLSTCVKTVRSLADMTGNLLSQSRRESAAVRTGSSQENEVELAVEKLAEELLWMTEKLRRYSVVEEGIKRWSYASGLASLSLTAASRVQGLLVKISAVLIGELARDSTKVPGQVTFRLLANWLPLFSHARNGLAFPVLTGYERVEVERAIDKAISTLPALDQEILLTNWLQDFSVSASEWPNLQSAYDRWCHSTRQLVM